MIDCGRLYFFASFIPPGPSPNTKETGIAMLADSIEATLHSDKNMEESEVLNVINKIITSRLNEGELDNTGLSRTELNQIAEAFLSVWRSKNHQRIKYPDQDKKSEKKEIEKN